MVPEIVLPRPGRVEDARPAHGAEDRGEKGGEHHERYAYGVEGGYYHTEFGLACILVVEVEF